MSLSLDMRKKPLELAVRKFIFGSFRVFDDIDRRSTGLEQSETDIRSKASKMRTVLLRGSRLFREHLSTLLSDIDLVETTFLNQNSLEFPTEFFQPEYDLTAYLVTTWHLCEIFFLNQNNSNSLETIHWFKMNGVPPIDLAASLEVFRSVRCPQNIPVAQITDDLKGFWPSIYALILEGKLDGAWDVISLHSDLAAIITSEKSNNNDDRDILEAIHDVLFSHPYEQLVHSLSSNDPNTEPTDISPTITLEFKDWQDKVSNILQSQSSLLGRISELNTLLLLLVGDKDTLVRHSLGEWTTLGVGLFLYVYPPPLIRANISKIVESAMSMVLPRNDISEEEKEKEIRQRSTMCSIMNGDASVVLKSLVEVCGWGNSVNDHCTLFGLLSASHLTFLLARSGVNAVASTIYETSLAITADSTFQRTPHTGTEILSELLGGGKMGSTLSASLPNEASFVEELFLESTHRLNELQYPLDIVVGYLRACPLRGAEHARVLLPRRLIHSDATVFALCGALRTFGLYGEVKAVLASRGSWWLQQKDSSSGSSGGKVVKALRFYQLAGDVDRTNALLDRMLWRCCTALVCASQALAAHQKTHPNGMQYDTAQYLPLLPKGLRMHPVRPRGPVLTGDNTLADYWDMRHYPESHPRETPSPLNGAPTLDDEVEKLFLAISDAEELLGALLSHEGGEEAGLETAALRQFVGAVRALLTRAVPSTERTEWTNELNLTQGLCGIPCGVWKFMSGKAAGGHGDRGVEDVLRFAADTLCGLIREETAPMRFWLPLLELCVGLDGVMDSKKCAYLFSKGQAYCLLEAVERVLAVHANYNLQPIMVAGVSSAEKEVDEQNVRSLRLGLLGILSCAVIQANADAGYTRVKVEEEARSLKIAEYQRLRSPVEKVKQHDALEMLSISAFL